jgi:hypothetical protein
LIDYTHLPFLHAVAELNSFLIANVLAPSPILDCTLKILERPGVRNNSVRKAGIGSREIGSGATASGQHIDVTASELEGSRLWEVVSSGGITVSRDVLQGIGDLVVQDFGLATRDPLAEQRRRRGVATHALAPIQSLSKSNLTEPDLGRP